MKRKTLILAVISITFISSLFSQTISPGYIDGHLYFKFNDSYSIGFKVNENTSIDYDQLPDLHYLFDRYGVTLITRPLLIFDDQRLARIIRIEFSDAENIDIFIKELELNPDIEYAEKVPYVKEFVTYNDPYYANLSGLNFKWHLEKINAAQAWGLQTGSASVKVAIVDNAVWGAHPDLNISTSNQCNVGNGTTSPGNSAPPTSVSQSTNCTEDDIYEGECQSYKWSHGTHCAGLVGATNNNGIGISSIGGGVTLMGVRAANDDRVMYYNANGVSWAIDNGAKVVSMSYGSVNQSTSERNMYQTAVDNGVILIAAAGNDGDGDNEISYPAGYPMVISVASIDNNGRLSNFSQWGTGRADIAAPGGYDIYYGSIAYPNILSTTYCTNQFYRLIVDMYDFNGTYYDGMQGTSMACPMVAGLVGLMASAYPDITYTQVKSCLQSTATALSSGSNPIDGNGYINAYAAVGCAQSLAGTSGGDCSWLTNITQTDNDNMNEPGGAYLWGQDRTNGIVTYAERFVNTTTGTIDSIEVYVYKAASLTPSYSNVTFRIYGESAGSPGTVLGSKTLAYSYFTQNSVKSIKFDTPVSVSGNFYVGF
ncbi:MAG: S8 family serine peptidase, partial [Bacteroidales bacterium]|nr:S8 family serine peptidase [Bacteroidales bacterium]